MRIVGSRFQLLSCAAHVLESECKFYKMAQNEYSNMIRECNSTELDTCLVQIEWDLYCRFILSAAALDFHSCLALTLIGDGAGDNIIMIPIE